MIFRTSKTTTSMGLWLTALLTALNDNLVKAAIVVYAALTVPSDQAAITGLVASGLLMAPFVVFSGWAGAFADKFDKARLVKLVKWSEVGLAIAATAAMLAGSLPYMLAVVFLLGTQSAFFGPLKNGLIPERFGREEIVGFNGVMETLVFLGILVGTVAGGLLAGPETLVWAGVVAIAVAGLGVAVAHTIPEHGAANPELKVPLNPLVGGWRAVRMTLSVRETARSAGLAAWFWAVGSIYLSTLPAHLRETLGASEGMITAVLALFALGIGAGSVAATRLLNGRIGAETLWPAALLIALAGGGIAIGFRWIPSGAGTAALFTTLPGLFVSGCLAVVAFAGGLFAIPLKAILQAFAPVEARAQSLGGAMVITSAAIAGTSGLVAAATVAGLSTGALYWGGAASALLAMVFAALAFPRAALKSLGRITLRGVCSLEINGAEHLRTDGPVVFVSNHVSFADGPMLFSLLERDAEIAVNSTWAKGGLLARVGDICGIRPIDNQNPLEAKNLAKTVREGGAALIFHEGRISTHGALMRPNPGSSWIADLAGAPIVPIHIDGLQASRFNRSIPGLLRRLFPKVHITVGQPERLKIDPDLTGTARRSAATLALHDRMEALRMQALLRHETLPEMFKASFEVLDRNDIAVTDSTWNELSRKKLMIGAAALSAKLQRLTAQDEAVGVLLPSASGSAVALMGLWRAGRTAAILNPTLGPGPMMSAINTGQVQKILTSKAFVEKAEIGATIEELQARGIEILWTEHIKDSIGKLDKLTAMVAARRPTDVPVKASDRAVVLFTSGTEGTPKGVVLTHHNLVANVAQLRARTDVSSRDRVFSAMPLFHSFGLTGGLLLPLAVGAPLMLYPSPLHYRIVPEMLYSHQATLVFGTDTFLQGWARKAQQYDLSTLRAAIAGAEPVKATTRALYADKFGVRILEGYGATEAGPVIALNTPQNAKAGTVGRALPGIELDFEEISGLPGKKLLIKGPNVKSGYLLSDAPGQLVPTPNGWYDTGDLVTIDAEGFVSIVGRIKRFAKIGGEMISLAAVEKLAADVWPDVRLAVITLPDARKGEKTVLVTTQAGLQRQTLSEAAKAARATDLMVPSEILVLADIPLLASGKIDYPTLIRNVDARPVSAA
jgi:acyl-[acyl-carrier-protein]-phospholipid O-acyltransferase/long-chain-fatty-acid--[acyl-carrier-protein] ligase